MPCNRFIGETLVSKYLVAFKGVCGFCSCCYVPRTVPSYKHLDEPLDEGRFVFVSVTALASATNALKAKVRYQQKALDAGKINVEIELKILGLRVMTVISLPWNLYLAFTAGNRRQQVTSVRRISLVRQALHLHL